MRLSPYQTEPRFPPHTSPFPLGLLSHGKPTKPAPQPTPPPQVPVYIGGRGLPANVVMREDLPEAGLANITATYINLLGLTAPANYKPSLITTE